MNDTFRTGRAGERKFEQLCDDANLIVTSRSPDMTGKDRFVEFPLRCLNPDISYDKRPAPLECCVQIKTTQSNTSRITMKLSNAERLCRDTKPAFIFVARRIGTKITEMYLLHVDEKIIEKVLRRLRMAQACGDDSIHKIDISFSFGGDEKISDEPRVLRQKFEDFIGNDMFAYSAKKEHLLKTLGYTEDRYRLSLEFVETTQDEFLDGLLGLKELNARSLTEFENRFDIELPSMNTSAPSVLKFKPKHKEECAVKLSDIDGICVATISGNACFASLGKDKGAPNKLMIDTPLLRFVFSNNDIKMTTLSDGRFVASYKDLLDAFKSLKMMYLRKFIIEVVKDGATLGAPIVVDECESLDAKNIDMTINLIEKCIFLKSFDHFIDANVDLNDLLQNSRSICEAHRRLTSDSGMAAYFDVSGNGAESFDLPHEKCVELQPVILGDELFAFAISANATIVRADGEIKIELISEKVLTCEKINEPYFENYMRLRARLERISGIKMVLARMLSD